MVPAMTTIQMGSLQPALEALADGVCILDSTWRVTFWNAAAEELLGVSRQRIQGRVLWEALPVLRETATWSALHAAVADNAVQDYVEPLPGAGARRFAAVHAAPLPGGSLLLQMRDATEEITRSTEHVTVLESIRDGFIAVDSAWRVVYINGVAESLFRFSRDQVLGLSLWPLLPRGPVTIAENLRATMEDGEPRHLREVRPEGRFFRGRIFDLWIYPLPGGGTSLMFEDVTERVEYERELARLVVKANEANEAKGRFFAAISHELRTPLNAIVGYTHLLTSSTYGPMPAAAQRAAERTGVCAEHLARLVDDVLLLTTAEIGRLPVIPEEVRLAEFLPSALEPHRHQAEAKRLKFALEIAPREAVIETDPQRLRQLLAALVSNAVKFTAAGSVHVEVRVETAESDRDPALAIRVRDTGRGIPIEAQGRIFEPFEQTGDPSRSQSMTMGSGLGLTVAQQLARLLRGRLTLESSSDAGSCFRLQIPLRIS